MGGVGMIVGSSAHQHHQQRHRRRMATATCLLLLALVVLIAAALPAPARAHKSPSRRNDDDDDRPGDITTEAGCRRQRNKRKGCAPGTFQTTKKAPCQPCPPGTYSCGGHCAKSCQSCPAGTTTAGFGAQGPNQCSISTKTIGGGREPDSFRDPVTGNVSAEFINAFNSAFNLLQNFTENVEQVPAVDIQLFINPTVRRRRRLLAGGSEPSGGGDVAVDISPGATPELFVQVTNLGQPVNVSLTVTVRVVKLTASKANPACFINTPADPPPPFCGQTIVSNVTVTTPADGRATSITLAPIVGSDGDEFFISAYALAPPPLLSPAQFITSDPLFLIIVGPGLLQLTLTTPVTVQGTTTGTPGSPFDANFNVSAALTLSGGVPLGLDATAGYEIAVCKPNEEGPSGSICGGNQQQVSDKYVGNLTGGLTGPVQVLLRNAPQNGDNVTFNVAVRVFTASNGTLATQNEVVFLPNKYALSVTGPAGGSISGPADTKTNVTLRLARNGNLATAGPNSGGTAQLDVCVYGASGSSDPAPATCVGLSGPTFSSGPAKLKNGAAKVEITLIDASGDGYPGGYKYLMAASLPLVNSDLTAEGSATALFTLIPGPSTPTRRHRRVLRSLTTPDGVSLGDAPPPVVVPAGEGPVGESAWRSTTTSRGSEAGAAAGPVVHIRQIIDDDDNNGEEEEEQADNNSDDASRITDTNNVKQSFARVLLSADGGDGGDTAHSAARRRRLLAWQEEVTGVARAATRRRLLQTNTTTNNTACSFLKINGTTATRIFLPACKLISSYGQAAVRRDQGFNTNACSSYASSQLAEAAYRTKTGVALPRISERGLYYCDSRTANNNATLKAVLQQRDGGRAFVLPQQPQGWRALYGLSLAEQIGVPLASRNGSTCFGFDRVGVSYFDAATNGTSISARAADPFCTSGGRTLCRVRNFQYVPLTPTVAEDYVTVLNFIRDNGGVGAKIALNSDYLNALRNPAFDPDKNFIPFPFLPQDTQFIHSLMIAGWDFLSNNTNNWSFYVLDSNPGILPNRTAAGKGLWRIQMASKFNQGNGLGVFYGGTRYIGGRITP